MHDMLEETPAFQELMKYSQEKAKLVELRNALFDITMELFPQLRLSARELIDTISDTQVLHIAIVKMLSFKNSEDALHYLQTIKG